MEDNFATGYAVGRDSSGSNGGFGGYGAGEWIWIIVLFALWQNGFGNNNGGGNHYYGNGISENYALVTDVATLERKMDTIQAGICDSTFALNNTMTNGFANVQNTLCQGFNGINQGLTVQGYETRNAITDLGYALKDCCCTTQRSIDGLKYQMATDTCDIKSALAMSTRDIIDSNRAGTDAILGFLTNEKIESQRERISTLESQLSQQKLGSYLLSELKPCPSAAYIVPNPNCCYNYAVTGFGYNAPNSCGCGC